MDSVKIGEAQAAAVAVSHATRVSLQDIEEAILFEHTYRAKWTLWTSERRVPSSAVAALSILTICVLVMRNGFTVIGKSAPADAANFNEELGRKFAREDAIRQLWPLMGFALRDRLAAT